MVGLESSTFVEILCWVLIFLARYWMNGAGLDKTPLKLGKNQAVLDGVRPMGLQLSR